MAIKHGSMDFPTGLTATGVLLHELVTTEEDVVHESMAKDGTFSEGKSIRKKTSYSASGEMLDTAALPSVGSGDAVASSPHVDSVRQTEKNEGAADFSIEAHEYAAGEGDFGT